MMNMLKKKRPDKGVDPTMLMMIDDSDNGHDWTNDDEDDDDDDDDEYDASLHKPKAASTTNDKKTSTTTESSDPQIATSETKAVWRSKILVYVILTIFAIVTSAIAFYFVREDEIDDNTFEVSLVSCLLLLLC